jgi:hypothetical protein
MMAKALAPQAQSHKCLFCHAAASAMRLKISQADTANEAPLQHRRCNQMDRSALVDMPASATWGLGAHPTINCAEVVDCGTHYGLSRTSYSPTVKSALAGADAPQWLDSMHDELNSMTSNDVNDLVEPPNDCNVVGSKWVLKYKGKARREIERRNSRLVDQGFSHKPGVSFHDLYSPTEHQATFRTLMRISAVRCEV